MGDTMDEDPSGIAKWIPGLRTVRTYDRRWTRSDVVAGVVLAAILVPQGLAYAELAGLPPVTGLYTSIGCLVGYAQPAFYALGCGSGEMRIGAASDHWDDLRDAEFGTFLNGPFHAAEFEDGEEQGDLGRLFRENLFA